LYVQVLPPGAATGPALPTIRTPPSICPADDSYQQRRGLRDFIHRKFGSDAETIQYKHKYKQNTKYNDQVHHIIIHADLYSAWSVTIHRLGAGVAAAEGEAAA